jgi:hypothetical protein
VDKDLLGPRVGIFRSGSTDVQWLGGAVGVSTGPRLSGTPASVTLPKGSCDPLSANGPDLVPATVALRRGSG